MMSVVSDNEDDGEYDDDNEDYGDYNDDNDSDYNDDKESEGYSDYPPSTRLHNTKYVQIEFFRMFLYWKNPKHTRYQNDEILDEGTRAWSSNNWFCYSVVFDIDFKNLLNWFLKSGLH
jgi:hypothetical protein